MSKYTNNNANKTQNQNLSLNNIGIYNQAVKDNLKNLKLNAITQHTIKHFIDNAQRNKLSEAKYNEAVEIFNNTHGLLLLKKGAKKEDTQKHYAYINYPFLDRMAVKNTMDNYRQYVYKYNENVAIENNSIRKYNNTIVKHHLQLTDAQKKRKAKFMAANKREFARNYNEMVVVENNLDAIVPKKTIQKIKYSSELVFHVLLGFYVSQLKTRNAYLLEMNRTTSVLKNSLPKLKIDSRKLATHKIADIPRLSICKKTAQNHIKRLREAGILMNYTFVNQNKPISVNFNNKIITILDGNLPKLQISEKQAVTPPTSKSLRDNNDTTRTKILKEKEIKDCANSTALNKCGSMLANGNESNAECLAGGYKNTKGISTEKENCNGNENKIKLPDFLNNKTVPKRKTNLFTDNFTSKLADESELAKQLAAGNFNNYKGLRYDYLLKVEQYALVSNEEFKQIVIQDFIKIAAKIWKNHSVYVGEWRKTINTLKTQMFANIVNKSTVIEKLKEYRWKLEFARKWFAKKTEVNALFPFAYFDKTRTKSNELGFYGLHSVWKSHLKYQEKKKVETKKQIQESTARKRRLSAQKKLTNAISKYELGKYNYEQLFNYVQDNLPNEYLILLPSLIKNQNTNLA
ncbi:hypothetical protein [Tenacibaculum soleae]|uniref:hypothetical protein n=1 Tax=Tenacibaculum soleae TaxID=447689 RepID=UPI0023007714|nr:hypothetical protein [Tenacibaculum soleae]